MVEVLTADDLVRRCKPVTALLDGIFEQSDLLAIAEDVVRSAKALFERRLETYFTQKRIAQIPDSDMTLGTNYDVEEDGMPFNTKAWNNSIPSITLRKRPAVSVQRARLVKSTDNEIAVFPNEWCKLNTRTGVLSFVPLGTMNVAMTGWPVYILDVFARGIGHTSVPHMLAVDYTAGWIASDATELPEALYEVRDIILNEAQGRFLLAVRDAVPNGLSMDGFSQQMDSVEQRLERLAQRTEKFIADWRRTNGPPGVSLI